MPSHEADAFDEFETRYRREYKVFYGFLIGFYVMSQRTDGYFWSTECSTTQGSPRVRGAEVGVEQCDRVGCPRQTEVVARGHRGEVLAKLVLGGGASEVERGERGVVELLAQPGVDLLGEGCMSASPLYGSVPWYRRGMKLFVLALLVTIGCKGKDADGNKSAPGSAVAGSATTAGSAPPSGSSTTAATTVGSSAGSAAGATDERCAATCRFLADTPLAEVAQKVKSTCGTEWTATTTDCAQLDYQRNCIYATAGYTFKKKRYQTAFGKEPWYKARADFKEKDLSQVAQANVSDLKKQAQACRQGDDVSDADKKVIDAWMAKVRTGKPEIPDIFVDENEWDGTPTPRAELEEWLRSWKDELAPPRKLQYHAGAIGDKLEAATQGKNVRIMTVYSYDPTPLPPGTDCSDEQCEGGASGLQLAIDDKGKVVGLARGMSSACPFAYLLTAQGPVLQGEIIRNLVSRDSERTQPLAVQLPRCSGQVTFRITEEKREVTRLDALALVVDGETILPDACGALCGNDGVARVLTQGDAFDVTFTLPAGARCERVTLLANGYYDRLPAEPSW
ncbi:MAG: YARHG domain-containing protein [Kofleriaceae bacterium]|nr:YARHG domain-containing protein [Kofleriaceae bacterium]